LLLLLLLLLLLVVVVVSVLVVRVFVYIVLAGDDVRLMLEFDLHVSRVQLLLTQRQLQHLANTNIFTSIHRTASKTKPHSARIRTVYITYGCSCRALISSS